MAKIEHHHWLLLIQINLVTKFQFKQNFVQKLLKEGISSLKQKK